MCTIALRLTLALAASCAELLGVVSAVLDPFMPLVRAYVTPLAGTCTAVLVAAPAHCRRCVPCSGHCADRFVGVGGVGALLADAASDDDGTVG